MPSETPMGVSKTKANAIEIEDQKLEPDLSSVDLHLSDLGLHLRSLAPTLRQDRAREHTAGPSKGREKKEGGVRRLKR
eukprot:48068-Rhodomonas_salina.2